MRLLREGDMSVKTVITDMMTLHAFRVSDDVGCFVMENIGQVAGVKFAGLKWAYHRECVLHSTHVRAAVALASNYRFFWCDQAPPPANNIKRNCAICGKPLEARDGQP
jgi:hypothetical protein